MYTCTVSVTKTISSKELDDLIVGDSFNSMATRWRYSCNVINSIREVEVADGIGDLGAGLFEDFEYFDKEDMSDMFKRAMLEKMQLMGRKYSPRLLFPHLAEDPPPKWQCLVCQSLIKGR